MGKSYTVNEGDGAFYGPKLDFHLADSIGRTWQCGTIQLDMQLPERFELEYVGEDGAKHRPVMIHRVVLGSIERFIGVITEHFAGAFPTWLAPVQVKVMTITDRSRPWAEEVTRRLEAAGVRVEATCAMRRSATRSARPRASRYPTCSSSATRRSRRARSPCAPAPEATRAPCPSTPSRKRCSRR